VRAQPTGERETLSCELVFRSVGYRGLPCPGLPYDEQSGTMPNDGGRVLGDNGAALAGVYCAGWIKRGPTGVIGTNKKDATETVEALLADAEAGTIGGTGAPAEAVDALLAERGINAVVYAGWEAIDAAERAAGEPQGRPRIKLTSWETLLSAARTTR
jgi:ferredoxin--NADP+ reductase